MTSSNRGRSMVSLGLHAGRLAVGLQFCLALCGLRKGLGEVAADRGPELYMQSIVLGLVTPGP